jgi:hypothetical protein
MKSFYEFNGSWLYIFDRLVGIITPANITKFTIWESRSTSKKHLLIVYEVKLNSELERKAGVNRISESEFLMKYKNTMNQHVIHGFNEFVNETKINPLLSFMKRLSFLF